MSRQNELRKYIVKALGRSNVNFCESSLDLLEEAYNLGKYDGTKQQRTKRAEPEAQVSLDEDLNFLK